MNNFFLKSEKIFLRPYQADDAESVCQWFNDPEVTYYMFTGQKPAVIEQVGETMAKDTQAANNVILVICNTKGEAIGLVGLYEINPIARKGEMRIIIGNKDYWGKGYGTEAVELITYYGFDRLNLNRICLGFTDTHEKAKRAYEKAGYVLEGVFRQNIYRNSRYYDSIMMSILRDDYYKNFFEKHKEKFSVK